MSNPKRRFDSQHASPNPGKTRDFNKPQRDDTARGPRTYGTEWPKNPGRKKISYIWPEVSKELEKFTFFWRADSPFSQHHQAGFVLDKMHFNCSEQYYMYQKAVVFNDRRCANKIMETSDPARQKSIAKGIPSFDQEVWDRVSYDVVKRANIAKFGANKRLLNLLVATRGTELVEASPKDQKWGIGMEADRSDALRRITWKGENKLGKILTEIRDNEFKDVEYRPERALHDQLYGYVYFWRSSSPFSPKHLAPFKTDRLSFVSLFHYLMFKAAELSGNRYTIDKVSREMRQNLIEKLAYKENINMTEWKNSMAKNLIEGNFYKFKDNPNLKALLLATNGKMLVYQSTFEGIGNGLEEEDVHEVVTSFQWSGQNLLGTILTFMRDEWIKYPDITLNEFQKRTIPSYNLEAINLMHMKGQEPPELKDDAEQSQCFTKKSDSKISHGKDDSMWDYPSSGATNSRANSEAMHDSKKMMKDSRRVNEEPRKIREEASSNKSEDEKNRESLDMNDSMQDFQPNKIPTKTEVNDSKKNKKKGNKSVENSEQEREKASSSKSDLLKENLGTLLLKEPSPSSSKDKKLQDPQDMEIDSDDEKTCKTGESQMTKSKKRREKKRRHKERMK